MTVDLQDNCNMKFGVASDWLGLFTGVVPWRLPIYWAAVERLGWYFVKVTATMEWLVLKMFKSKQLGSGYSHSEWLVSD